MFHAFSISSVTQLSALLRNTALQTPSKRRLAGGTPRPCPDGAVGTSRRISDCTCGHPEPWRTGDARHRARIAHQRCAAAARGAGGPLASSARVRLLLELNVYKIFFDLVCLIIV